MRNIIQQRPAWIARNGIIVIFILLMIMLFVAATIEISDGKTFIEKVMNK